LSFNELQQLRFGMGVALLNLATIAVLNIPLLILQVPADAALVMAESR
jgi:hypothetical protein